MGSSFIHIIRTDSNVFFLMAEEYSIVYMYHSFLLWSLFPSFCWLWAFFVLLFIILLGGKLGCLLEIFLLSWRRLYLGLISFSIMPSRSIHAAANGRIFFFLMVEYYSTVHIPHIFLSIPRINGHLDCFHTLTVVNNTAMNMEVQISFQITVFIFFRYISRSVISGS